MQDDLIDKVDNHIDIASHIDNPYSIRMTLSISYIDLPYRYQITSCHSVNTTPPNVTEELRRSPAATTTPDLPTATAWSWTRIANPRFLTEMASYDVD